MVKFGWIGLAAALLGGVGAAQAGSLALVIGNAAYDASPAIAPLPECATAAREAGAALRRAGFSVVERHDVGRGEFDAAVAGFARSLREAPGSASVIYLCGRFAQQGTRLFALPVSATLQREADVLTQGVLARLALDAMQRGQVRAGLLMLEGGGPAQAEALVALVPTAAAAGLGYASGATPGPLPAALAEELRGAHVRLDGLMAGLRRRVPDALLGEVGARGDLVGAPAPEPAAQPPVTPAPAVVAPPSPSAAETPRPAERAEPPAGPDERQMTEADRRRIQAALARLGYYAGLPDGSFGPNTRAAIRRYQFELGAELTGTLTPAQSGRLLGLR